MHSSTTLILGPEYDAALWLRLKAAVEARGGTISDSSWGVGGSQEITQYKIVLPSGELQAEQETYIGLTLSGPVELVKELALEVRGT